MGFIGETSFHEGWTECANVLRERDEDNVKAMSEELDAFLAFVSFRIPQPLRLSPQY